MIGRVCFLVGLNYQIIILNEVKKRLSGGEPTVITVIINFNITHN